MSEQGATLQTYNNELVKCIEDLHRKRSEIGEEISAEEAEKATIQNEIHALTERLAVVNQSLTKKMATRAEYDRTISETETAYKTILKSSQTLLHLLKRESANLQASGTASSSFLNPNHHHQQQQELLPKDSSFTDLRAANNGHVQAPHHQHASMRREEREPLSQQAHPLLRQPGQQAPTSTSPQHTYFNTAHMTPAKSRDY
eukprot:m.24057 g.24057  ORF g.24057 m.24057 type:complete len:202 (+) comp13299_c0_seq1:38-643(+)